MDNQTTKQQQQQHYHQSTVHCISTTDLSRASASATIRYRCIPSCCGRCRKCTATVQRLEQVIEWLTYQIDCVPCDVLLDLQQHQQPLCSALLRALPQVRVGSGAIHQGQYRHRATTSKALSHQCIEFRSTADLHHVRERSRASTYASGSDRWHTCIIQSHNVSGIALTLSTISNSIIDQLISLSLSLSVLLLLLLTWPSQREFVKMFDLNCLR
jgi:hypothetical protein